MTVTTNAVTESPLHVISAKVVDSGLNDNVFYQLFTSTTLSPTALARVFQQYYYYIRTFPQILAGLSHRVDDEFVRMKLARTVVSELGDNGAGDAHYKMFERVLTSVGITLEDWRTARHIPEAVELVDGLRDLFLRQPTARALGGHYVIEEFGLPMINALYEGFRRYPGWNVADFAYFHLHMLIEGDHVDWIAAAVERICEDPAQRDDVLAGADQTIALLQRFWAGLYRCALDGPATAA
jgi:pyrroloquinoline-quinone synthase